MKAIKSELAVPRKPLGVRSEVQNATSSPNCTGWAWAVGELFFSQGLLGEKRWDLLLKRCFGTAARQDL